ncbi:hypothetical protein H2198_000356 [Neophaeococcomyces mojaviensis]|uniref:Uncharacterized protein n=1 Tax=Neophaeococcomyces mojaviensis TaxID=3383035 RepID=A0ACC3AK98_9EURO|nr:hypothetical protein H2198_000356 [Knufia sp. JES_112]
MVRQSKFADEFEHDLVTSTGEMSTDVRRRKPNGSAATSPSTATTKVEVDDSSSSVISVLDIFRIILALLVVTAGASHYVTSGESYIFGLPRPWFTKPAELKQYFRGPVNLTPAELAKYDGSDPGLPIYLAVNGIIFDVSAGSHTYGPGGSYHAFAGHDASRAFVTGCFMEDRTRDLRGAEEVYLPLEDPDEEISSGERKTRAERERRLAKKKVQEEVDKWVKFYSNSKKYFKVGQVIGVEEEPVGPAPTLCTAAQKGRPKRKNMNKSKEAPGKPVQ